MSVESINSNSVTTAQASVSESPSIERKGKTEQLAQAVKVEALTKAADSGPIDKVELEDAVTKLNDFMNSNTERNLSFSIDEETKEMVVTVRDTHTQEVIKQMPTEEALAVAKQIESMLGLILNDTA